MNKLKLFLVIVAVSMILLLSSMVAFPDWRNTVVDFFQGTVIAGAVTAFGGVAESIAANPFYQTYHPLLWLVLGAFTFVALHWAWGHRPRIIRTAAPPKIYQHVPETQPPTVMVTEPVPEKKKEPPPETPA